MARKPATKALHSYFAELCTAKILDYHAGKLPQSKMEQKLFKYSAESAAGGIVRMLFKWLEDGAVVPVEEMVAGATRVLGDVIGEDV